MSDGSVTSTVGNITGLPEIIGVGSPVLSTGSIANLMSIYGYSNGQQLWVGNTGGTWVPDPPSPQTPALDPLRYIQFDASPIPGNSFNVTNVSFNYGDFPLNTDFNILSFQAYYSTNGWNTGTVLNSNALIYLNTAMSLFSQPISVMVPSGQTFSLRIYPYPILHGIAMTPSFATHNNVVICGTTAPEITSVEKEKPASYTVYAPYPNPFNPVTTISYYIPNPGHVSLSVYSLSGQKAASLVDGFVKAGKHEITFDGSGLASGVYFYRFAAGGFSKTGKMLLIK